MALDALIDTPSLPPQATGATLPGQAADAAAANDIIPATTPEDALLAANYGDRGAANYRALRNASRAAPASMANLAAPTAAAPAAPAPPDSIGGSVSNLLGATLGGIATGDPGYGTKLAAARALATQQAQKRAQASAITDGTFIQQLRDKPIGMRAAMIQAYAAKQGRDMTPAEAAYIADIHPDVIAHTIERAKSGDVMALEQLGTLFAGDPVKLVDAQNEMRKTNAAADKLVAEATNAPKKAADAETKSALDIANKIRQTQQPPSPADIAVLTSAKLEAYQVPVPGAPGGTMWSTRPKSAAPNAVGTVSPTALSDKAARDAAEKKKQQTAASPIPPTTAEKLAGYDTALDIIHQLRELYKKGSPTDVERQSWLNRLKQEASYRWGFDMPDNLDEDTALRSLGAITAGRAFIQGRPNQQLMNEIWKHTGQNPLVSPDQMRDRLNIMERQVGDQKKRMIVYTQAGRGDLAEASEAGAPAAESGAPATPGGEISAQDFLSQ